MLGWLSILHARIFKKHLKFFLPCSGRPVFVYRFVTFLCSIFIIFIDIFEQK